MKTLRPLPFALVLALMIGFGWEAAQAATTLTLCQISGLPSTNVTAKESDFTPNTSISIEELIGAPFGFIVQTWESSQPRTAVDPELLARFPAILDAVGWLTGHPALYQLRNAIAARDEHALGALVALADSLGKACDTLLERCKQWRREEEWTALRHEAALLARLTAAIGRDGQRAHGLFLLANAHRSLGDSQGTIDAYKKAIEAASAVRDEHLLAVANDNLGNALADIGKFDEALDCYEDALRHERDRSGIRVIRANRANAWAALGEMRSAARELEEGVRDLERAGTSGRELSVALDNAAIPVAHLGEPVAALKMLDRARALFDPRDLAGRAVNALSRSNVHAILGDKNAAAQAFIEAHDLAFEHAHQRIDPEHYRRGFLAARAARLPADDEANRLFVQGMKAKDANAWGLALDSLQKATLRAREGGDHALALRISVNEAALKGDELGQVEQALTIATRVRHEAGERGLARPELMAIGTIGSLAARGADVREPLGPLGAFVMSAVLLDVHTRIVAATGLTAAEQKLETYDPGTIALELAKQAEEHHADVLAIRYYREAVDKARAVQGWSQLANRLAGLHSVLSRSGNVQEADTVAGEIAALLAKGVLPNRGQAVAHRALGFHYADRDRTVAIDHLRHACAILEGLSQQEKPGAGRANVARQFEGIYRTLARLLRQAGNDKASFEALQGEKGRRLIDALAALAPGNPPVRDAPPKADEVMALLGRLGGKEPTVLVDLAVDKDGLTAYLVGGGVVVRTIYIAGDPTDLTKGEWGDVLERDAHLVELCLRNSLLRDLAKAVTAAVPKECRLLLVPDQFLYNLPLHVIPVNGRPWCDRFSIGYLAAAGTLRFAPAQRPTVGRSLVAGDSRSDLPHAAAECKEVATTLGNKPLVGPECTRVAVEEALQGGKFDVVHLALHGRGDVWRGGRASLLLADGKGGTEWVAFDELAALPWRAELVVFSGCSTAVAGPRQGHELVGIARAAAERGAAAVIACLWPVNDEVAKIFMTAFYKELVSRRAAGHVDLRVVLDEARRALRTLLPAVSTAGAGRRDGRSLRPEAMPSMNRPKVDPAVADALKWAPFILLGDPILGD
jgi:CHAT domain-containing protein/tetratricopeptide (TPR) repeat protein